MGGSASMNLGMVGAALVLVGAWLWARGGRVERRALEHLPSLSVAQLLEAKWRSQSLRGWAVAAAATGVALMLLGEP